MFKWFWTLFSLGAPEQSFALIHAKSKTRFSPGKKKYRLEMST